MGSDLALATAPKSASCEIVAGASKKACLRVSEVETPGREKSQFHRIPKSISLPLTDLSPRHPFARYRGLAMDDNQRLLPSNDASDPESPASDPLINGETQRTSKGHFGPG